MTNALTVPAAQALARAAAEEGSKHISGQFLKFAKGRFAIGDDEVKIGREYVAHVSRWARGWTKFVDGVPTDRRIGLAVDSFAVPDRSELGDLDASKWPTGPDGKPKDCWVRQNFLPLEDKQTGEVVVFVSASKGGNGAIGDLATIAAQNAQRGEPVVRLGVDSYRHKQFGRIEVPQFAPVGWTGATVVSTGADFDDDLDF
jgi:hypothetical protein